MADRTKIPEINGIGGIKLIDPEIVTLDNGIRLGIIRDKSLEFVRLHIALKGGRKRQRKPLAANFTVRLMDIGSKTMTREEIAEKGDYMGTVLAGNATSDAGNTKIYMNALSRYTQKSLDILEMLIKEGTYPQKEVDVELQKSLAIKKMYDEQVGQMASKRLGEAMFGKRSYYGSFATDDDFTELRSEDLIRYRDENYSSDNTTMLICGDVTDETVRQINERFGGQDWKGMKTEYARENIMERTDERLIYVEKKDAVQNSINMGGQTLEKDTEEYYKLNVALSLLGGGSLNSRLMSNIREEKGYTYGIYASLMREDGFAYPMISTEADCKYTDAIIEETAKEMRRMRTEKVSDDELEKLKRFMMGQVARGFDNLFQMGYYAFETMYAGSPKDRIERQINVTKTITPEDIIEVSQKYLNEEDYITVVAGRKV